MMKRVLQSLLALAFAGAVAAVHAQPMAFVEGVHYQELPQPVRTSNPDKIEVVEVFWYGCGACFQFQPLIANWQANKADDIEFVHFPAIWQPVMNVHAQAYYTAEALGVLDAVHSRIFDAIHLQNNRLQNERQLAALFAQAGVSEDDFSQAFNSFAVRTKVNQAERRVRDYRVSGTPSMVVNGKYLVSVNNAIRTQQDLLAAVDFLVARERSAR